MLKHALIVLTLLSAPAAALAQTDAKAVNFNLLPPVKSTDPEFKGPTNAAILYYRAFMFMNEETSKKVSDAISQTDPNWIPDAEVCKLLADNDNAIYTFIRGSKLEIADFGVEYSAGIGALLPHPGKLRAGARLLAVDARPLAHEGKPDEAAERVAAIFNMSRHTTQERLLISSLVSIAIHSLGCVQAEYLINNNLHGQGQEIVSHPSPIAPTQSLAALRTLNRNATPETLRLPSPSTGSSRTDPVATMQPQFSRDPDSVANLLGSNR